MLPKLICIFLLICCSRGNNDPVFRIWHGHEISIQDTPYQISLQFAGEHFCGGTILTNDAILTAAHCVKGASRRPPAEVKIRAGSSSRLEGGIVIGLRHMIAHYEYNISAHRDYDVGILWLDDKLLFSKDIQPIAEYAKEGDIIAPGTKAFISGWGFSEAPIFPVILRGLEISVWDFKKCVDLWQSHSNEITERMMCAGDPKKDSCRRDSGGGLVVNGTKLIGVTSFGPTPCGDDTFPGIYADVRAVSSWIDAILRDPPPYP